MKWDILLCLIFMGLINFVSAGDIGMVDNSAWGGNLTAARFSATAFGDIDNDGDDDLALIGCTAGGQDACAGVIAKIYTNNGTTLTENQTWQQNLTSVGVGSLAFGDIDNDGDLDLFLMGCNSSSAVFSTNCQGTRFSKIYINNGTSFVENSIWQGNLTGVTDASSSLGDIDNDGDLDLVMNGATAVARISKVYINNGTSLVEDLIWQADLSGVTEGQLALGNIDGDDRLDLVIVGDDGSGNFVDIYINNGTSFVANSTWSTNLQSMHFATVLFGDYNNDAKLDLMICGQIGGDHCELYKNDGSTLLVNQTEDDNGFTGVFRASIAFGDYDNDGDLDLAQVGNEAGRSLIADNNESNNYDFVFDIFAPPIIPENYLHGSIAWNDLDNDGDLDLIFVGLDSATTTVSKIFINNNTISNTLPSAPSSFTSNFTDGVLNFSWGNGSDTETPTLGLYYNLMVGNSTKNHTIVSGIYGGTSGGGEGSGGGANGYFGNMMQRKSISLNVNLSNGTYYWYVQTIDTGLAKSNWSERQSFTVGTDTIAPLISSISSSVTSSTATITWTTDESSNSTVYYGTTNATTSSSSSDDLVTSHSIPLTGLSASTLYYYNVSSCDYWGNCNTSTQYTFTTSAAVVNGGSSSSGGGGSSITTTTITPTLKEFDIDFSETESGNLEVKQGDVKTFSFNNQIKHSITVLTLTLDSITLLITSNPITIQIKTGETKQVDINQDGVNDFEIKLISIRNGKAKFSLNKLEGAEIVGKEELEGAVRKEALFDVNVNIVNLFEVIKSGREVIAEIEAFNVNNIGQVDVLVDYYVTSKEDNVTRLAEGSDSLAVEAVASFVRSLVVPYSVKSGNYLFNVDIIYKGEVLASSSAEFRVIKNYEIIIGVGVFLLLVVGVFIYLWGIKKRGEKMEKKEEKDVSMMKKEIKKLKKGYLKKGSKRKGG